MGSIFHYPWFLLINGQILCKKQSNFLFICFKFSSLQIDLLRKTYSFPKKKKKYKKIPYFITIRNELQFKKKCI